MHRRKARGVNNLGKGVSIFFVSRSLFVRRGLYMRVFQGDNSHEQLSGLWWSLIDEVNGLKLLQSLYHFLCPFMAEVL